MKLTLASVALAALILVAHSMAYQDEVNVDEERWSIKHLVPGATCYVYREGGWERCDEEQYVEMRRDYLTPTNSARSAGRNQ